MLEKREMQVMALDVFPNHPSYRTHKLASGENTLQISQKSSYSKPSNVCTVL